MPRGFTAETDGTLEIDFGAPSPELNKVEDISGYDPLEAAVFGEEGVPQPVEQEEQPEPPPQPQPRPQPQPEPEIKGSVHARLRVLEREKKEARRREKEAQDRLEQVIALVLEKNQAEPEEEQFEIDPVVRLERKVDRVAQEIQKTREEEEEEAEQQELLREQATANYAIRAFAQQAGEVYTKAVSHLAAIEMDEYLSEHDDVTPEEAEATLLEKMENDKIRWLRQGKHPGQELFLRAIRRGFQVPVQPQRQAATPTPAPAPKPQQNATEEIRQENRRSVRSIASMAGSAAPNTTNVKAYANMSEEDFQNKVLSAVRERGQIRNSPRMREMLAGKGRAH